MDGWSQSGDDRPVRCVPYQPLVTVVVALSAGIAADRYGPAAMSWVGLWCLATVGLAGWYWLWRVRRETAAAWVLLATVALVGAARHHAHWYLFDRDEVARFAQIDSEPVCIEAIALSAPAFLPAPEWTPLRAIPAVMRSRVEVELTAIRNGAEWRPAAGLARVYVDGQVLGVGAGDRLRVFAQFSRIPPARIPGQFDFADHNRAERRMASLRTTTPAALRIVQRAGMWQFEHAIDAVRSAGRRVLRDAIAPQRVELASAILLGAREGLPREETRSFMLTGTTHLLVVSGLHIGILAASWFAIVSWLGVSRRAALATTIAVVLFYTLVADARPSAVRACVLTSLACVAAWNGRPVVALNSLAFAAVFILMLNPSDLFRVGPQLSFVAVATLVCVSGWKSRRNRNIDPLDRLIAATRPWYVRGAKVVGRWYWMLLIATAAVWLVTLPLVMHRFHVAALVALPLTLAVWPVFLVTMWSGFITLTVGWLVPPLAPIIGRLCDAMLWALESLVAVAEAVPAGHVWLPGPAGWWVLGFYLGLVAMMCWGRWLLAVRWQVALLAAWIVVGVVPSIVGHLRPGEFRCAVLAVGHGTSVVLTAPNGETLVYDAGSLGSPDRAAQGVADYLWHCGKRRIDGIVLSHADLDHYNAVPGLLERFDVRAIYVSPVMFSGFGEEAGNRALREVHAAIDRSGVPVREIWSGDRLHVGPEVAIDVLHPPRRGVIGSDNANSVTLTVAYGPWKFLLPGDLETPGVEDVLAELPQDCDVLLAPHHGSRRSDPPGFAAWSTPEWVVVSGGDANLGSVVDTYERAGAELWRTDRHGTIEFSVREDQMVVTSVWEETEDHDLEHGLN